MDAIALIDKYYADNPRLRELLWIHSRQVADRCLKIAALHPELDLDKAFLEEAALLHDIGILHTHAPLYFMYGRRTLYLPRLSRGGDVACGRVSAPCQGVRASYRRGAFTGRSRSAKACRYPYRIIIRRLWKNSSSVMRINFIPNPIPTGKKHRNRR